MLFSFQTFTFNENANWEYKARELHVSRAKNTAFCVIKMIISFVQTRNFKYRYNATQRLNQTVCFLIFNQYKTPWIQVRKTLQRPKTVCIFRHGDGTGHSRWFSDFNDLYFNKFLLTLVFLSFFWSFLNSKNYSWSLIKRIKLYTLRWKHTFTNKL